MNTQNLGPLVGAGQVNKKHFVKTALAHQFGRQTADIVGGGQHKDPAIALAHPGEQGAQHPLRQAAIAGVVTGGQPFFDFVEPEHAGSHGFRRFQRLPQIALGFAVVHIVKHAEIQAQQG